MLRLSKRFIASESKNPNSKTSLLFSNYYKLFNIPYNASKDEIKVLEELPVLPTLDPVRALFALLA